MSQVEAAHLSARGGVLVGKTCQPHVDIHHNYFIEMRQRHPSVWMVEYGKERDHTRYTDGSGVLMQKLAHESILTIPVGPIFIGLRSFLVITEPFPVLWYWATQGFAVGRAG
jgi:hypothetical protein